MLSLARCVLYDYVFFTQLFFWGGFFVLFFSRKQASNASTYASQPVPSLRSDDVAVQLVTYVLATSIISRLFSTCFHFVCLQCVVPSWHFNVDSPAKQRQRPRLDQHWIMFRFCKSNQLWCREVVPRSLLSIWVSKGCMSKLNQHLIMLWFCKLNQRFYRDVIQSYLSTWEYNYTFNYNVVWIWNTIMTMLTDLVITY